MHKTLTIIRHGSFVLGSAFLAWGSVLLYLDREPLSFAVEPIPGPTTLNEQGQEETRVRVHLRNNGRTRISIIAVGPML